MELYLPELTARPVTWLSGGGRDNDVVISTRVRLARNVDGFPFSAKLNEEKSGALCEFLQTHIRNTEAVRHMNFIQLRRTSDVCRDVLLERFLISRELSDARYDRAVVFDELETTSIMVNEEDHLRLQTLQAGFDVEGAFERMLTIDRALEREVDYAFDSELGYMTSCPTNTGTGLRVSVMLHLPGLVTAPRELKRVFNVASRLSLAVRGIHGEGTQASGAFFQMSNQITLGRTEREILEDLSLVINKVVEFERRVRSVLFETKAAELQKRIDSGLELLRSGRPVALEPAVAALSALLLGIASGRVEALTREDVLRLLVWIYPGHLQASVGRRMPPAEVDRERGALLRRRLSA